MSTLRGKPSRRFRLGRVPKCRRASPRALLVAALLAAGAGAAAGAQTSPPDEPDIAEREAQLEQMWRDALSLGDVDPWRELQLWGVILQSETMLERQRAAAAGTLETWDSAAVVERVLTRWQRERPDVGGPDLFRAFQIRDPQEQSRAVVALLDRYPDDPLVVSQAAERLRQQGETRRATEVLEELRLRHPDRSLVYDLLARHYGALQNETRQEEVLADWAEAAPGDPALVSRWMGSGLPRQEPGATARVVERFLAARPAGDAALGACLLIARRGDPVQAEGARACIARLAADPRSHEALAARAGTALIELAAADGELSTVRAALAELAPEERLTATLGVARQLEAPARCAARVELLAELVPEAADEERLSRAVAAALEPCALQPAAEALYLELLRRATASGVLAAVQAWAHRVNERWQGDLPAAAVAPLLERRLEAEPDAEALLRALDIAYQLAAADERRLDLLGRWQQRSPDSFRGEQAIALAAGLELRGDDDGALLVLERQLERRFDQPVAEALWGLYLRSGGQDQGERFAAGLVASGERHRVAIGHLLAARSAVLRREYAEAERRYWESLRNEIPRTDAAAELLALAELQGDRDRVAELARRICAETPLGLRRDPVRCASELARRAGSGQVAAALLAEQARELPGDVATLQELAAAARAVGRLEVAERALRRLVELDPRDLGGWTQLAVLLEAQERLEEAEELLQRARGAFAPPPSMLLRSVARTALAARRPRRAIELLHEARESLPPGADPAWIDAELRQAYAGLGARRDESGPQRDLVEARRAAGDGDPASMLELARRTLTREGEPALCDEGLAALRRAADAGHPGAGAFLGKLLLYGRGECVAAAPAEAAPWLEAAADAGDPGAAYDLAIALLSGAAGEPAPGRARELLESAAGEGSVLAVETLAFLEASGVGLGRDPAAARDRVAQAARLGSDGLSHLTRAIGSSAALRALFERGVERLEALAGGDPAAAALLATLYYRGAGVDPDPERAVALARAAAAAGEAGAMRLLGHAHRHGSGVERDGAEGVRWWRRGARAGDSFCMMFYSQALMRGEHAERDPEAGLAWLLRAGEAGNWWAIGDLGRLYDEGWYGLPKDRERAASWKRRRAELGDFEARGWLVYHGYDEAPPQP